MKTKEQIVLAQKAIEVLQDYVELSKTLNKIKLPENKKVVEEQIEKNVVSVLNIVEEL